MWNTILYLKSHKRRPVRTAVPRGLRDVQQDLPAGWCSRCGSEIHGRSCVACKEVREYEHPK